MEKAIIVGLDLGTHRDFAHSMEELEELAIACELEVVGELTQHAQAVNKAFYIGTGKVEQLQMLAEEAETDLIIFDNALSPMQLRNLQQKLRMPIMDRTTLILEIFSKRARTREAKLQVDVAALQYALPRLVGLHDALSRQGGASGAMSNKGAGEKKLELDRRHIEQRLATLRRELAQVEKDRNTQRKARQKNAIPLVSLVGYTNAGKSSVMNALLAYCDREEEKQVLEKDMLFATLETTVRKVNREDGKSFLLSDTVGFINELPHNLVQAFRSTLEEVKNADLLLQVIDFSDPHYREHMKVTKDTLEELGAGKIPMLYLYNKMDLVAMHNADITYPQVKDNKVFLAAGKGIGIEALLLAIEKQLFGSREIYELLLPYDAGKDLNMLRQNAQILECEYRENGIYVKAFLDARMAGKCEKYKIDYS